MSEKQEVVFYCTRVQRDALRFLSDEKGITFSKIVSNALENVEISSIKNVEPNQSEGLSRAYEIMAMKALVSPDAKKKYDEIPYKKLYIEMLPNLMVELNRITH